MPKGLQPLTMFVTAAAAAATVEGFPATVMRMGSDVWSIWMLHWYVLCATWQCPWIKGR